GLAGEPPATIKILADGTCWYKVDPVGNGSLRPPAKTKHTLPPAQLRRLGALLKQTDWLTKKTDLTNKLLSDTEYMLTLNREGRETIITTSVRSEPYQALVTFVEGGAAQ